MGVGNGNPKSGNKGSNHSFEHRNLQLLGEILAGLGGGTTVEFVGVEEITGLSGNTNSAFKSVTFVNVAGTITIQGSTPLPAGTYSFNSPNGTLDPIAYNATGSTDCKLFYQK